MRSRCSRFVGDTPLLFHSTLSRVRTARVGDDVGGGVATGAVRFVHGTEDLSCLGDRNSDASASDEGTGVASTPSGEYMDQRTTRTSLHLCGHSLRCRGVTVVARRHRTPTQSPKRSARVTRAHTYTTRSRRVSVTGASRVECLRHLVGLVELMQCVLCWLAERAGPRTDNKLHTGEP